MKNKKYTYILFPLVIIVWGAIVYKGIAYYLENDSSSGVDKIEELTTLKINQADTFSLLLNYADPFLKESVSELPVPVYENSPTLSVKKSTVIVKEKKDNTPITWPTILYCGIFKNKQNDKICSIIKINGTEHLMKVGDTYSDVSLIKLYKDSAIVQYKNIKKTLSKY